MRNISILIPFYEKHEALYQMFPELQLQLHQDDEVIIIDDHSPSGPPEIECNCTTIIQPPKVTPHIYRLDTIRNYGIEHVKHDAIIILDPDCIPNYRLLDYARKMFDPSVLFGGCIDKVQKDDTVILDPRRRDGRSYWCDLRDKGGAGIWGGIMMFSKRRTKLVKWFNVDYDGAWGMAENDFASKCYHSGIRLRYSMELSVTHLWHPSNRDGYARNRELWLTNRGKYSKTLNHFTPYNPAVAVLIVPTVNPYKLDQAMRGVFRHPIALKTRLVNNDQPSEQVKAMTSWGKRWAVDYVNHIPPQSLSTIQANAVKDYRNKGYRYLITVDDGVIPKPNSITNLILRMENSDMGEHMENGFTVKRLNETRGK